MEGGLIDAGETTEIVEREGIGGSADVSGDCGEFGDGGEREVEGIEGELAVGAGGEIQVEVAEDDIALREVDGAADIAADECWDADGGEGGRGGGGGRGVGGGRRAEVEVEGDVVEDEFVEGLGWAEGDGVAKIVAGGD